MPSKRPQNQPEYHQVRLQAALAKLGIEPEQLQGAPPLTEILQNTNGGLPAVIQAMRFSEDPSVEAFLDIYDRSTTLDQRIVPWEAYAILAEVDFIQLLGAIILALRQHSVNLVKVLSISHHPETVKTRIAQAKLPDGWRDRDALDRALGFAPVPKGQTINVNFGERDEPNERGIEGGDVDVDYLFPSLGETQKQIRSENE